jgi:thymidylate synthase (FAD)
MRQIDKSTATARESSIYLDELLGWKFPVLDHGWIRCVDYMGSDSDIVAAARVSYGKETSANPGGLINYLVKHRHSSPIEYGEIAFHVKAPIFVLRQWLRHRTATTSEQSGRYVELGNEFHLPDSFYVKAENNKQGRGGDIAHGSGDFIRRAREDNERAFLLYYAMLDEGIAPEQAREHLPLSTYTEFRWKIDLHNLLHFLKLRTDPHAQAEIRAYACVIEDMVRGWVPLVYGAWVEHVKESVTFSKSAMRVLKKICSGGSGRDEGMRMLGDLPKREREEIEDILELEDFAFYSAS